MAEDQITNSSIRSDAASYRLFNKYRPLQPDEIRLLEILPPSSKGLTKLWRSNDAVECNIIYSHLNSNVRYEALSYCWGNSKPTVEIVVANYDGHRFQVTESLLAALRQFRRPDKSRLVWLDFICINQGDQIEKGQQVSRMTDIYRKADQVLGWLGPSDKAGESMYALNQFRLSAKTEPKDFNPAWLSDLSTFLSKPFFSRIWIIQEVAVARRLSLCFGRYEFSWEDFRGLLDCTLEQFGDVMNTANADTGLERILMLLSTRNLVSEHIPQTRPETATFYEYRTSRMDAGRSVVNVEPDDHIKFVNSSRTFGSTDPRDRIFALSGLMPDPCRNVNPDYDRENTPDKVFSDFAIRMMTRMQNLDILSQAGIHAGDLPSWVPDYTRRLAHHPLDLHRYEASSEIFEYRKPPVTGVLLVTGYTLGTIRELEAGFSNTHDKVDDSCFALRWRPARCPPPERIQIFERALINAMSLAYPLYYKDQLQKDPTTTNYVKLGKSLVTGASTIADVATRNRTPRISPEMERAWQAAAVRACSSASVQDFEVMYSKLLLGGPTLPGLPSELNAKYMNVILGVWQENLKGNPWRSRQRGGFGDGNEVPVEIKVAHLDAKNAPTKDNGTLRPKQPIRNAEVYYIGDAVSDATDKVKRYLAKRNPGDNNKLGNQNQLSETEKKIAEYEKRPRATRRQDDQDVKKVLARMFNREVERMSEGRKLAVTDQAMGVAWVPQLAQADDQIWILAGARVPFVLRPVCERSGVYRVVGEAYHHGFMNGEYFCQERWQIQGNGSGPQREDLMLI